VILLHINRVIDWRKIKMCLK